MNKKVLICALMGAALLASDALYAGNRAGAFTFTPGAAYDFFADKRNISDAWLLPTLQLAYNFDQKWAIEGMYGNFNASQTGTGATGSVSGNLYTVDGIYRFAKYGMLEPYTSFGVGVYSINPNGTSASNEANINAGLGAQMFFDDVVALRAEVRDLYTMFGGKNDVTAGFGVSFLMGGCCHCQKAAVYKGDS